MYLKSLKLAGFKSFADRARLEFRPGVTVVVGPNGSGKSNLVDALSWVLGTQSAKSLRTGKMEEVIFAGTATRPPASKAEVTLVVDNAERRLDLDLDEVSITRRLYRDGSSDYELNGIPCRLLDIQDLLSDSGVGRHQHVIISQGEIGRILSASPEEHRAVIEESAGILKHRRRRERAERRLERSDEDVTRLRDLVGEIERQMKPLRRQAKAAREYDELKEEVTSLTLYLGGKSLERIDADNSDAQAEQRDLLAQVEEAGRRITLLSERVAELESSTAGLTTELDSTTSAAALLETTAERLRRTASVSHERARAMSGRYEATVERRRDLEEERSTLLEEMAQVESELGESQKAAETAESRFRRLEEEARALQTQGSMSPEGAVGAARGQLSALESSLTRDRLELERLDRRLEALAAQEMSEREETSQLNAEIKSFDTETGGLQKRYDAMTRRRAIEQDRWEAAVGMLDEARTGVATAESRMAALSESLGQGRPELRERLLASAGARGVLLALLGVPSGLERAVDAALGRWSAAVAFEDMDALKEALEAVKTEAVGGVPVVAAMSGVTAPARETSEALGVVALVDRLAPDAADLAARLVGDVVLVDNWRQGWELVARHPALRAVTNEGDLVALSGVQIGDPAASGPALLEEAERVLSEARISLARAQSIHVAARRDFEGAREAERLALEELERAETALAGRSEALARITRSADALREERERLEQRHGLVAEAIADAETQAPLLKERIAALEGEEAARMKVWEELEAKRNTVLAELEQTRAAWHEASTQVRAVAERRKLIEERASSINHELGRLDGEAVPATHPSSLRDLGEFARRGVATVEQAITVLRERQHDLRRDLGTSVAALSSGRGELENLRESVASGRERLGELEVRLTELTMRRESVVERIRREAGAGADDALGASRPEVPEDVDLEELLETRAAALRRLGPINPLAAREFEALEERHTFLTEQMDDVESSRRELRKVIAALEEEIISRFRDAFDAVAEAYQRYLSALFPGGRGKIALADASDPHSGVIIEAQPLGKKITQMSLLSGGERSLVALAFLFAVFEARPSPFYVLDEVEAALDDANLRRFLRIVDAFRARAQLVIVTHQQQTMGAADVLYGVTMEPGGSSRAVRKDMTGVTAGQVA